MKIYRTIAEFQRVRDKNLSVGFVPTMGALHQGHIALIKRSVVENPVTVCSIFINPTQFNNPVDLENYPRTEEEDLKLLQENNCTFVFIPSINEMYPDKNLLEINFGLLETTMEGAFRPGHFKGVATVVKKLLDIVHPDTAYFGEKDFQQLAVIRNLAKQLRLQIKIVACSTVREKDGLALSSRNIHLTREERASAPVIYKSLVSAKENYKKNISINEIKKETIEKIEITNLFKVQYFEIVNAETLQSIDNIINDISVQACIAVLTSKTRLIDNINLTG